MTRPTEDPTLRQGGDLRGLPEEGRYLDLGTCINRYGPPPGVAEALRELDVRRLQPHPYGAEEMFVTAYADYLDVRADDLVAGRGITEFIRLIAAVVPDDRVAVVTPDYTDTIRSFRNHLAPRDGAVDTADNRLSRVAEGMRRFDCVVLSNPNNPLGIHIPPLELTTLCRAYPDSMLIVDEAYIDFTSGGLQESMIRADVTNVAVLLSPNKLFGIAGTRTGVMWTRHERFRRVVSERRLNWPISYLDALVARAALRSTDWIADARIRLLSTAQKLESLLIERYPSVVAGVPVHFRFVATEHPTEAHRDLLSSGIVVRAFSGRRPGSLPGLRITAPTEAELPMLAAALVGVARCGLVRSR